MLKEQVYRLAAEAAANAVAVIDRYEGRESNLWTQHTSGEQARLWKEAQELHENVKSGKALDFSVTDFRKVLQTSILLSMLAYFDHELDQPEVKYRDETDGASKGPALVKPETKVGLGSMPSKPGQETAMGGVEPSLDKVVK